MTEPPAREQPARPQCCCRLLRPDAVFHDSCPAVTSGPDEPICQDCVDSGHPESEFFDPIIKRRNP